MRYVGGLLIAMVLAAAAAFVAWPGNGHSSTPAAPGHDAGPGHGVVPSTPHAPAVDGKALFNMDCAFCHGKEGRGDGAAGQTLNPRPRDFSRGLFKIRSTPSGSLPTDQDLFDVITNGMPGTAMPSWRVLPEAERWALVKRVKELSQYDDPDEGKPFNFFAEKTAAAPVTVPPEPPATAESIALGRSVYQKAGCVACHGESGKGDGPSAATLQDSWDRPIRPNNLTRGVFKGGSTDRDIFLRLSTGMTGSPMPQFPPDSVTDAERWALVHYVKSLSAGQPDFPAVVLAPGNAANWKEPPAGSGDLAARGKYLFHSLACSACHGNEGKGGVVNPNYARGTIPPLNTLAENMMKLEEHDDAQAIISCLEKGVPLANLASKPPVPKFGVVLTEYNAIHDVVQNGSPAAARDPNDLPPPLVMPAWGKVVSKADVDAIITYLLSQQPWEEEK